LTVVLPGFELGTRTAQAGCKGYHVLDDIGGRLHT